MYWNRILPLRLPVYPWLTLTWDVLKYVVGSRPIILLHRLTLTWDVLKFRSITWPTG